LFSFPGGIQYICLRAISVNQRSWQILRAAPVTSSLILGFAFLLVVWDFLFIFLTVHNCLCIVVFLGTSKTRKAQNSEIFSYGGAAYPSPGNLRTSQHCILPCTARAMCWDDLALLLCLYKSSELGRSGTL